MMMNWHHHGIPFVFSLALAVLGAMPVPATAAPDAGPPAVSGGAARVWFLRPLDGTNGDVEGAAPEIYANRTPIAALPAGSKFFRDFPAGTYQFTVQPYGEPTGAADSVRLAPGSETYLQVQWAASWEEGYPGGSGPDSHSFFVLTMSPQLAQAYLQSLTYLGQR
jgi:hypothetical protein